MVARAAVALHGAYTVPDTQSHAMHSLSKPGSSALNDKSFDFPGETPHGHAVTHWFEALYVNSNLNGLTAAVSGDVPERAATLVDCDESEITVSVEVESQLIASGDHVGLSKMKTAASKSLRLNVENDRKRHYAKLEDDNKLFAMIIGTMQNTAPLLRDSLRLNCEVKEHVGYYSGREAIKQILVHCGDKSLKGIDSDYYQALDDKMRDPANHLRSGCSSVSFTTLARVFMTSINPFLSRPYEGDSLGEYIIKLLPYDYRDAKERLLDDLRRDGTIGQSSRVISACLIVVTRRAVSTGTSGALDTLSDESVLLTLQAEPSRVEIGTYAAAKGAGKGARVTFIPDLPNTFCRACPHKSRDGKITYD